MKIYLAGPLFTMAERYYNETIRDLLVDKGYQVFLPQELEEAKQLLTPESVKIIFKKNSLELRNSDIVVAVANGPDVDSGTSWECGYAYAMGIPVVVLRDDFRRGGDGPKNINLMLSESMSGMVEGTMTNYVEDVVEKLDGVIRSVCK